MSRDIELMLELMKEMREEQKEHAKNSSLHREETVKWQAQADARTERIEVDLREHKEGVIQNRAVLASNMVRIEALERPVAAKKYLYKKYMKIGGAISITLTIVGGIAKLAGLF